MTGRSFTRGVWPLVTAVLVLATAHLASNAPQPSAVSVDTDDLGGVVSSAKRAEAGVWVIAETSDLPTKFARIVVTDDRGRYLMPDLPAKATYNVWVRGYGLADGKGTTSKVLKSQVHPDPLAR